MSRTAPAQLYSALRKRSRLLGAIRSLEADGELNGRKRIALAEAEFRLAILHTTELQESIERIQKAIAYDPFHPKYYFHLGRLLYRNGDYRSALHEYRHALKLAPSSHRAYVHLALVLLDLNELEKNIGRAILDSLARGAEYELGEHLTQLDELIKAQLAKDKKAQPQGKREPKEEAGNQPPTMPCRWNGVWRLALLEQLTRPKPITGQINRHLEQGEKSVDGADIAEYAVASLFLLLSGEPPKVIRAMLNGKKLRSQGGHPAVRLVDAAAYLSESENREEIVERAVEKLQAGDLPIEIVCCLHYMTYGPDSSLTAGEALSLLDSYPRAIRERQCFKELRLAVLDGYARRAWRDQRFDHAKLLWHETIPLDPNRIAVFHNLALVATRSSAQADYAHAWGRAIELRYLIAAAGGDVQVLMEDRRTIHLAFAQQSRQRYCSSPTLPGQPPPKEELLAWMFDKDALEIWLREWDLYYLNSRLRFRSPVHVLGIARDASPELTATARDNLLHQIDTSLRSRPWAGIKTFCDLAEKLVCKAFETASDLVERARDLHYEPEKTEANSLAQEAIDRGFLLYRMMTLLADTATEEDISTGCTIARHLFALPWTILQPICVSQGRIERDADLVEAFENFLLQLAASDQSVPKTDREVSQRLSSLDECIAILPHRVELRLVRCQFLLRANQNAEAYTRALESFSLISKIKDKKTARSMEKNLADIIDSAAFAELPERVRRPSSVEEAEECLKQGGPVLERFPRAGGLRAFLADIKIQTGGAKGIDEAKIWIEEGFKEALNDEQRERFQSLLEKADAQSRVIGAIEEIKKLLEGASKSVNEAIERINDDPSSDSVRNADRALSAAIRDAEQAVRLARDAELKDAEYQAETLARQFREVQKRLQDH